MSETFNKVLIQSTDPITGPVSYLTSLNQDINAPLIVEGGAIFKKGIQIGGIPTNVPGSMYFNTSLNLFIGVDYNGSSVTLSGGGGGGSVTPGDTPSISLYNAGGILYGSLVNPLPINLTVTTNLTVGSTLQTLNARVTNLSVLSTGIVLGNGSASAGLGIPGVVIGYNAGHSTLEDSIAIGTNAGRYGMDDQSVAIGFNAGLSSMDMNSVAIGTDAGNYNMSYQSVAIGSTTGASNMGANSVAIGTDAGRNDMADESVAIGAGAGYTNMSANSVAIGAGAGYSNMGDNSVAIGSNASIDGGGYSS
jgi:hypothetical protein